ncbi:MAG: metal ABC transporter permease [Alteromonadaceae bacterium]|nr:MAG: metal ABC transporter permease [Alteromonadaceae bacterium]
MRSQNTDANIKDVNWRYLLALLPYLAEHRRRIAFALGCLVLAKIASVGTPFILKHLVDGLDQSELANTFVVLPLGLLAAYGLARFSVALFGELRDTIFGRITERAMRRIGLKVFEHMHALDLKFHLERRTGGVSRDMERGTNGISFLMRFMVFNIVPTLIEISFIVVILLARYSAWYAVVILAAVVSYVAFSIFATERRTRYVRKMNQAESQSSSRAVDSLLNYETVKYFTNEQYEAQHYDKELASWEQARRQNRLSMFFLNGGQAFIIAASMCASMTLAATDMMAGNMTLGDFVLINAFMMQVFLPLNFLGFVYREMKGSMANIEKMFQLLDVQSAIVEPPDAKALEVTAGEIRFEQVGFNYHPDRVILKDVSFCVRPNSKVAIVGSSGAGKSTIFKLLFRFYDVNNGRISIDGQDISTVSLASLRRAIGVVPQDTVLFNTSILENIRYGRIDASDDDVTEAIRLAHLESFIEQLPDGVHTTVGERGLKLSGGEKQRVAIARTLLKRPPIMVFDEATSSLDSRSEQSILQAIKEISQQQTSIVIAHRLSTVIDADTILVLDKGEIVEQGSHRDLLKQQGKYALLWEMQQKDTY